ncbi:MAG TPA: GGDEF domain-containing protein [Pirellulales bacterium]|nr:GGDEF domain-containing protein [Pirellulales bacterium]
MDAFPWLVALSGLILIIDLAAGMAIGWWLHETSNVRQQAVNARQALDALRDLHDLTCDVAGRVSQHVHHVGAISQELIALRANCAGTKDHAVVDAVSRIVQVNDELTQQLTEAKLELNRQSELIETQAAAAMTDLATGFPNRRGFDDELRRRLAQWQQQDTPISVLMVDLDNLQQLEQEHGKEAADDVLRGVATVLSETMRAMDLIGRYDDGQFAVALPGAELSEAQSAAERLRTAVAEREFHIGDTPVHVTVSQGVAQAQPGDNMGSLLERTSAALAASQEAGGNCAFLHDGGKCQAVARTAAGSESPEAVQEDLMALARQLQTMPADAHTDPLTGLLNRRSFFEGLRHRIVEHNLGNVPLSLAVIDLDNMTNFNRIRGNLMGDVVLRTVTQIVRTATRANIDMAARYHEDKLAIVLVNTRLDDALLAADRIRRAVASCKLKSESTQITVTVSVGVAELERGSDAVALLKKCEDAVRAAKAAGRNRTFYHDGVRAQPARSFALAGARQ